MVTMIRPRMKKWFGVCYLIAGIALCLVMAILRPGDYRGSFHGRYYFLEGELQSVHLEAKTEPAWYWTRPGNHRYAQATMTTRATEEEIGTVTERTVHLDLAEGTWRDDENTSTIDADGLAQALTGRPGGQDADPILDEQVQHLLTTLHEMAAGDALPPRHHPYDAEMASGWATYQHFTLGWYVGPIIVLGWLLTWPVFLVVLKPPADAPWFSPRRAFLITGGVVALIDVILVGLAAALPPGGLVEIVEGLLCLAALPVVSLLPIRNVPGWPDLAFGAAAWAVLISVGSLHFSKGRPNAEDTV
jgi:hypothetical protein